MWVWGGEGEWRVGQARLGGGSRERRAPSVTFAPPPNSSPSPDPFPDTHTCGPCGVQGIQDGSSVRGASHLSLDASALLVVLRAREARAPHQPQPAAQQLLDQVKPLKVQQHNQAVLHLARVGQLG